MEDLIDFATSVCRKCKHRKNHHCTTTYLMSTHTKETQSCGYNMNNQQCSCNGFEPIMVVRPDLLEEVNKALPGNKILAAWITGMCDDYIAGRLSRNGLLKRLSTVDNLVVMQIMNLLDKVR